MSMSRDLEEHYLNERTRTMTTPTPWKLEDYLNGNHLVIGDNTTEICYLPKLSKDDAALIVTAVNNHARLMEENRVMREALEMRLAVITLDKETEEYFAEEVKRIRKALSLAGAS